VIFLQKGAVVSLKKCKQIYTRTLHFPWPIHCIQNPHITLLCRCEFRKNLCCEFHTSLKGINKIFRSSLFWDVTQWWLVVTNQHFGTTHQAHVQELSSPRRNFSLFFFSLSCNLGQSRYRRHPQQLTLRRLMSYIYGAPILDVSRSHTTTQHSR